MSETVRVPVTKASLRRIERLVRDTPHDGVVRIGEHVVTRKFAVHLCGLLRHKLQQGEEG